MRGLQRRIAGGISEVQFRDPLACAIRMDPGTIKETHVPVPHIPANLL